MKFLLVLGQAGEGCDYTIGCGYKHIIVEFDNYPTNEQLKEITTEYYSSQESMLEVAYLIPMEQVIELPVADWYNDAVIAREELEKERIRQRELQELERLQNKYKK